LQQKNPKGAHSEELHHHLQQARGLEQRPLVPDRAAFRGQPFRLPPLRQALLEPFLEKEKKKKWETECTGPREPFAKGADAVSTWDQAREGRGAGVP